MQGDAKVIEFLNAVLKGELTATNQYWLHYRMLDNWGIRRLAAKEREESIEEMRHADKLVARILFLDGFPGMQALGRLRIGETVPELLKADLALEMEALALLREAIRHCEAVSDFASRELFVDILEDEEEHVDFIETQFTLIEAMGLPAYIQLQSKPADD